MPGSYVMDGEHRVYQGWLQWVASMPLVTIPKAHFEAAMWSSGRGALVAGCEVSLVALGGPCLLLNA